MTYDEYARLPGVRASDLNRMKISPLHYRYPVPAEDTDTAGRGVLRAIHSLVLEPQHYDRDFVVFDGVRRGREYEACVRRNRGATILNQREAGIAEAVAGHILRHPVAGPFFVPEKTLSVFGAEITVEWDYPGTGIACKARIDRLAMGADGRAVMLDLKSYGTTDPGQVWSRANKLGAFIQMAHYREGVWLALGVDDARTMIVSAETKPPYDVGVFEVGPQDLQDAYAERAEIMMRLEDCLRDDYWPGRSEEVQRLRRTEWAGIEDEIHE